ncbi:hypothetical protein BTM25_19680 [Actinomadura rubteroloni]|uniref:DUF3558 domain-containing protein n=1 Tax=Actinomadura rubteroloni TaxID=1926885 RepID=A0A2P4UR80_9ACTN|nr:hypothetical protein [Actinomadura rubteroloni]POM27552.1 hypothetical protein BTM25_19680 [Actinomadura rubteroloni]
MGKGPGIGPRRPQERFERVYSGPERPRGPRRPRGLPLALTAVAVALAGGAALVLAPGGGPGEGRRPPPSAAPSRPAAPRPGAPVTRLGDPCAGVGRATLDRLVPGAVPRRHTDASTATCTFTAPGKRYRWLTVDELLVAPSGGDPSGAARQTFAAALRQATGEPAQRTLTLERIDGLGEEAFHWFTVDEPPSTVTGQVTVRVRNVVVTVAYSEAAPGRGGPAAARSACLANAEGAAREVLAGFR